MDLNVIHEQARLTRRAVDALINVATAVTHVGNADPDELEHLRQYAEYLPARLAEATEELLRDERLASPQRRRGRRPGR